MSSKLHEAVMSTELDIHLHDTGQLLVEQGVLSRGKPTTLQKVSWVKLVAHGSDRVKEFCTQG